MRDGELGRDELSLELGLAGKRFKSDPRKWAAGPATTAVTATNRIVWCQFFSGKPFFSTTGITVDIILKKGMLVPDNVVSLKIL